MRLIVLYLVSILFVPQSVSADTGVQVELSRCIDGDTAAFLIDGVIEKTRFLAIDTPESTNKIEPYGKEASAFTCSQLESANKIELKFEEKNKYDKYDRLLAWIFVDDVLLQDVIVQEGYGEVAYLYADYPYTDQLKESEALAKEKKLRIWSDYEEENNTWMIAILVVLLLLVFLFQKKGKKRSMNKIKKMIKNAK